MRKVLAVILAATMAAGVATTAFAANLSDYDKYNDATIGVSDVGKYPTEDGSPTGKPLEPIQPAAKDSAAVWNAYKKALNKYKAAIDAYNKSAAGIDAPLLPINPDTVYNDTVKEVSPLPGAPAKSASAATWEDYLDTYAANAEPYKVAGVLPPSEPANPKTASDVSAVTGSKKLYDRYLTIMTYYGFRVTSTSENLFNWQYDGIGNLNVALNAGSGVIEGEYYFDLEASTNNKVYSITDINRANNQPEDIIWVYGNDDNDDQSIFLITDATANKPEAHVRDGEISISMKTALKDTTLVGIGTFLGRNMGGTATPDAYTHTVPADINNTTSGLQTIQSPVNNSVRDGNTYTGTPITIMVPNGSNFTLQNYILNGRVIPGGTLTGEGTTTQYDVYRDSVIRLPAGSVITVVNPAEYFGDSVARGNLTLYEMVVTSQAKPNRDLDTSDYTVEVDYKTKVTKIKGRYGYSNKRDVESGERYVINNSPRRRFEGTGSVFNFNETINDEVRIDVQSYVDLYFNGNYGTDTENLRVVTDDIKEVEDFFGDYDVDYYDFVGQPKFAREVTCIIDGDSEAYIYEFDKNTGEMVDITDECTYESDGFKFKRREFKTYVMLEEPYDGGNVKTEKETVSSEPTSTVDPGKANPGTGAYPEI